MDRSEARLIQHPEASRLRAPVYSIEGLHRDIRGLGIRVQGRRYGGYII